MNDFADLIRFSESVGKNPLLAPGCSGNTSVKIDGVMWVKASGKALRQAGCEETFVPVDLSRVLEGLASGRGLRAYGDYPTTLKPSVETWTHALLPQKVVAHLHAVNTVAWSVRAEGERLLRDRLRGLRWAWAPYATSGPDLGRAVLAAARTVPDVVVLANHGLVVAAGGFTEAMRLVEEVERRLSQPVRAVRAPDVRALKSRIDEPGWQIPVNRTLHVPGTDDCAFRLAMGGELYPCHVVYVRPHLAVVEAGESAALTVRRHEASTGRRALILLVPERECCFIVMPTRRRRNSSVFWRRCWRGWIRPRRCAG